MVLLVSTVLSAGYWALGVPYWLLLGPFSGVVEILPIIGPLLAGGAAIAVALTVSWQLAAEAAAFFVGFRLLQDYVLNPRVIGGAVGLPALVVLVAASTAGLLLGPAAVALATPLTVIVATVVDVAVRGRNPRSDDDLDSSRA
jgi:predicted PurR-regulated permease PerM